MTHTYVGLGESGEKVYLYDKEGGKKVRQVLWGDWLKIDDNHPPDELEEGWLPIIWAPKSLKKKLYIPKRHTTNKRPLEIIFLDVGQGDGLVMITPETARDERIMIVDAGEGWNMAAFLNARFKAYRGFRFHAAVLTHPDLDHYYGFKAIFEDHDIGFKTIYHNGLVERPVSGTFQKLGGVTKKDPVTGLKYIKELAEDTDAVEALFTDAAANKNYVFPRVMHEAIKNPRIKNFQMLSTHHGTVEGNRTYMPGFAPSDGREYDIEVLGPVVEFDGNGMPRLRRISSSYGETKNGHSVILRLTYGNFRILFGGDLNERAEKFLLTHYTQRKKFPSETSSDYREMVNAAKERFGAEVFKVCHHGSEKVTNAFLEAVNPACFVISSGDQEGHVHPRPDLLGRLGRFGRGESPVLLSTELQRSTREREDQKLVKKLLKNIDQLAENPSDDLKKVVSDGIRELAKTNVDVYGAIYLKTDGERLITAFKIEAKSDLEKWFYFEYALDESGELKLV